jgi:hypothetical protein
VLLCIFSFGLWPSLPLGRDDALKAADLNDDREGTIRLADAVLEAQGELPEAHIYPHAPVRSSKGYPAVLRASANADRGCHLIISRHTAIQTKTCPESKPKSRESPMASSGERLTRYQQICRFWTICNDSR